MGGPALSRAGAASHVALVSHVDGGQPQYGKVQSGDWVLEEGMVAPIHLLYPGGQFDRSWCGEVVEIASDGGKPLFSWGFDPITGR